MAGMPFTVELRSVAVVNMEASQFSIRSGPMPIQSGPPIWAMWAMWRRRSSSVGSGSGLMKSVERVKTDHTRLLGDRAILFVC
jgi:hypothetical protein